MREMRGGRRRGGGGRGLAERETRGCGKRGGGGGENESKRERERERKRATTARVWIRMVLHGVDRSLSFLPITVIYYRCRFFLKHWHF